MDINTTRDRFGCEQCWPDSAVAAWTAIQKTDRGDDLIEESHCHAMFRACRACSQTFVSVFTEKIDWAEGDDPQHWAVLPVTADEISFAVNPKSVHGFQPDRRSLQVDTPKGGGIDIFWSTGLFIGDHD